MSRIRFELDRRQFGRLRFSAPLAREGQKPARLEQVMPKALTEALDVRIETRRAGLFGPRVHSFRFHNETITLKSEADGTTVIDLGDVDDEAREILIEALRYSAEFDAH